ncbi:hypothetical protein CAS74_002822 [Pichia kudriavzevii]|uniref:GTPase-activating protein GYP5 n=1 Tax=Pichia kudriavzevii TaxID=4909 RepID=A0A1Z8JMN1_PICKU|nr:hypothetical protein CAS74_002822 [Pichia kudriavzevii]
MLPRVVQELIQASRKTAREFRKALDDVAELLNERQLEQALRERGQPVKVPVRNAKFNASNISLNFKSIRDVRLKQNNIRTRISVTNTLRAATYQAQPFRSPIRGCLFTRGPGSSLHNARMYSTFGPNMTHQVIENLSQSIRMLFIKGGETAQNMMTKESSFKVLNDDTFAEKDIELAGKVSDFSGLRENGCIVTFDLITPSIQYIPDSGFFDNDSSEKFHSIFESSMKHQEKVLNDVQLFRNNIGSTSFKFERKKDRNRLKFYVPSCDLMKMEYLLQEAGIQTAVVLVNRESPTSSFDNISNYSGPELVSDSDNDSVLSTDDDLSDYFASNSDERVSVLSSSNDYYDTLPSSMEERGPVRNETGEQGNSDQSGTSQEHEKEENVDEEDEDLFAAYEIDHPVSQPGNEETEAANASERSKKEEDSSSVKPDLPPRDTTTDVPVSTGKPDLPPRDVTNMPRSEEASEVDAEKDDQYTANTSREQHAGVPKTPTWFDFEHAGTDMYTSTLDSLSSPVNMNMAYTRFQENEDKLLQKEPVERDDIMHSRDSLKKTFNEIKTGLINQIDWEFWSEVFNDYSSIVKNKQSELRKNITKGIPMELRGMAWQIICDSNSMRLKEFFINTRNSRSDFEKLIRRDLARTRFIKDAQIRDKIEELFSIIKTYSLYDHEVGYTQGMAFITVPLLMNMEPDAAFCMLVRLMFTYGFRELYLPEMPGLHLRIYQFDRLMEDTLPELYNHLENQNIKSSMYAIQWFMTLFAYKFPLDMVLRIYDVVVAEGLESILKFALNLMMKNEQHLLTLKFDSLLDFLKEKIFYYYQETPNPNEEMANEATYQIDKFISDAMEINILPLTLQRYTTEFDEIDKLEKLREEQAKDLQSQNGLLTKEIRKIEALYAVLNKEHVEIANEMIQGKIKIGSLEEENQFLKEQIEQLETRLANLKANSDTKVDFTTSTKEIGTGLDEEIQSAMEKNLEVMDQNRILEDQLAELEEENRQLKEAKTKVSSVFGGLKKGKFW